MGPFLAILVAVLSFATAIPPAVAHYRRDRRGFWQTWKWIGVYALYVAVGLGILLLTLSGPQPPHRAAIAVVFTLSWIAYGVLRLIRLLSSDRQRPMWIDTRLGDHIATLVIVGTLAALFIF